MLSEELWILSSCLLRPHTHTHTHPFNGTFSRTTRVGRYQKGKTNLDFTEAGDSEWQWHQLGICKSAPRSRQNNHASTPPRSFLQAGCPSCRPTNSVKALKAHTLRPMSRNSVLEEFSVRSFAVIWEEI